ncbi:hypothetical protein AB0N89_02520 [Amycolatopsis sp. NPDC089917]|uniref:hypothetical protein n=1 Tax=Amycolatopsis sp. NPDC089917 TaxID=3155187 RepID=UPI00342FB744
MTSENKSPTEVRGEVTKMQRPLRRIPSLPEADSIRALRSKAKKQLGMSDRAAGAMSTLWVHPDQILPQLDNLRRLRIPGGDLVYIEGLAWTPRLMCDFCNPRNAADYTYPVAGTAVLDDDGVFTAETEARTAELALSVSGRDNLEIALERAMEKTRLKNTPYPPIADQGIMDAPFGVMAVLGFSDGSQDLAVPYVREGSSRVSWAQKVLGITPEDTLLRMPSTAKPMSEFIEEINTIVGKPADEITDEERGRVRCATTNFILIVGFEPDEPGTVDLAEAIKVKVAQEHLNVKVDWTEDAQNSVLADDCLAAVHRGGLMQSETEYRWLSGGLPHDYAVDAGAAEHRDDRFTRLMWLFTTEDSMVHQVIRQPIAFVLRKERHGRVQVRRTTKMPFAIELAAREFRGSQRYPDAAIERITKVMTNGGPLAMKTSWRPTSRSLTALTKAALADAETGNLGPASIELAMRALYYVAVHDVLRVPRNDLGANSDRRKIAEILESMALTARGVRQLADIIKDGRRGAHPVVRDEEHGQPVLSGDGKTAVTLSNTMLRYTLFPKDGRKDDQDGADPYMEAQKSIGKALKSLEDGISDLEGVTDEDGASVVEQQGVHRTTAKTWRKILSEAQEKIQEWYEAGVEYSATANEPPQPLLEELENEEETNDE